MIFNILLFLKMLEPTTSLVVVVVAIASKSDSFASALCFKDSKNKQFQVRTFTRKLYLPLK